MRIAWIVGRGGLLGSAIGRALARDGTTLFIPSASLPWGDREAVVASIRNEAARFVASARDATAWEIYWAAGIGSMASAAEALVTESVALDALLDALRAAAPGFSSGRLSLASSAGAVYAGVTDEVVSERTPVRPTTPYARVKLAQEAMVAAFGVRTGVPVSIARISTVYGVGQRVDKPQGLLTHISRCIVRNQPIRIFVPLDTIRDYIAADDAAAVMTAALRALDGPATSIKIIASERPTTISEILATFKRVSRRAPRVVTAGTAASGIYTRRIQFRSVVPPRREREPGSLLIGISAILSAERRRYGAGDAVV